MYNTKMPFYIDFGERDYPIRIKTMRGDHYYPQYITYHGWVPTSVQWHAVRIVRHVSGKFTWMKKLGSNAIEDGRIEQELTEQELTDLTLQILRSELRN